MFVFVWKKTPVVLFEMKRRKEGRKKCIANSERYKGKKEKKEKEKY